MCCFAAILYFVILWSSSFYLSIGIYFVYYILCDGFVSPTISMLTIAAPPNAKGQVIGFMMTAVSISLIIMASVVANMMSSNPMNHKHIAFVLILNTVIPSLLASFCYLMAAKDYEKTLKEQ